MHCSTRLKKKNLFKPLIKIIQVLTVLYFFFFSFFYSRPHCALSHHLKLSHQALISPISLISSHLQATPSPSQPTFISLICQALISKPRCRRRRPSPLSSLSSVKLSFLSSLKLSSPSPHRRHPSRRRRHPTPSQPMPQPNPLQVSALSSFVVNFLIVVLA